MQENSRQIGQEVGQQNPGGHPFEIDKDRSQKMAETDLPVSGPIGSFGQIPNIKREDPNKTANRRFGPTQLENEQEGNLPEREHFHRQ